MYRKFLRPLLKIWDYIYHRWLEEDADEIIKDKES